MTFFRQWLIVLLPILSVSGADFRTCEQAQRDLCRRLERSGGNLPEAGIFRGKGPDGFLSWAERADLEALVAARPRLPEDFRNRAADTIEAIEEFLQATPPNAYPVLAELKASLSTAAEDTARTRAHAATSGEAWAQPRSVDLRNPYAYRTLLMETARRRRVLDDEITQAKYLHHPNWIRATETFLKAKEDVLSVVEEIEGIAEGERRRLADKIATVRLLFPPPINRNSHFFERFDKTCRTNFEVAFYHRYNNSVIVCAGFFNTHRSESSLYLAIAHEIAHAIGPNVLSFDRFLSSAHFGILERLAERDETSCADWEIDKRHLFAMRPYQITDDRAPLRRLISCFEGHFGPNPPPSAEFVRVQIQRVLSPIVSRRESYRTLYDRLRHPESYLDPHNSIEKTYDPKRPGLSFSSPIDPNSTLLSFAHIFIFSREYGCFRQARGRDPKAFEVEKIIETTTLLNALLVEPLYFLRGTHDKNHEHIADWLAARALAKYARRASSEYEGRRAIVRTASAVVCPPGRDETNDRLFLTTFYAARALGQHAPYDRRLEGICFSDMKAALGYHPVAKEENFFDCRL